MYIYIYVYIYSIYTGPDCETTSLKTATWTIYTYICTYIQIYMYTYINICMRPSFAKGCAKYKIQYRIKGSPKKAKKANE